MDDDRLYGFSEHEHAMEDGRGYDLSGGEYAPPAIVPKVPPMARPVSPGTIEKSASLLRSLSFIAQRPAAGETGKDRAAAFAQAGKTMRIELQGAQMQRLRQAAPDLAPRLQSALLACCGSLLGSQDADSGFAWAMSELDDLAKNIPPAASAVFPGAYYYEIFTADIAELSRALAIRRRDEASRAALQADVLSVLARPGVGPAEVHGIGRAAAEAGLVAEASACRAYGELLEREQRTRLAHEASSTEAREARRAQKEAEAQRAREEREHNDERHRRQQLADELAGVKAALAREEEVRRKIEAANVETLQELRAQEEARWEAERRCQAEVVRSTEFEAQAYRAEEQMVSRVQAAESREVRAKGGVEPPPPCHVCICPVLTRHHHPASDLLLPLLLLLLLLLLGRRGPSRTTSRLSRSMSRLRGCVWRWRGVWPPWTASSEWKRAAHDPSPDPSPNHLTPSPSACEIERTRIGGPPLLLSLSRTFPLRICPSAPPHSLYSPPLPP